MPIQTTPLGRLDRAIAENLQDIRSCFEADAGIVLDFIVFISMKMKTDLFGYTRFTLREFCTLTGRHRQDLARKHPLFSSSQKKPPQIEGFLFESTFDYTLVLMMQRNLIFSRLVQTTANEKLIRLESIRLLQDVRINVARKSNEVKVYDVRLSPELLNGFIRRYYTLDVQAYRAAGKGRGREYRQFLVIYLSVLRHMLFSQSLIRTTVPLDFLARQAFLPESKKQFHRKESVNSLLSFIQTKTSFGFEYRFVPGHANLSLAVELVFEPPANRTDLVREHNFYFLLIQQLEQYYATLPVHTGKPDENEMHQLFQVWLNSQNNQEAKSGILRYCYRQIYHAELSDLAARAYIRDGLEGS